MKNKNMNKNMNNEFESIALFPIPELVSFPNAMVPLHVFEPRYRAMIKECVKKNIKIGVTHIEEVISKAPKEQLKEEILNSNQDNYSPKKVFSAGFCEIKDVTADGRLLVEINMTNRYTLENEVQHVPYKIYECSVYNDKEEQQDEKACVELRSLINTFLIDFANKEENKVFLELLESSRWSDMSLKDYSFKIFEVVRFEGDFAQSALEMKSSYERLKLVCKTLNLFN